MIQYCLKITHETTINYKEMQKKSKKLLLNDRLDIKQNKIFK